MTRHNDPEATKNAILDAAEDIFAEKGFAGTSMSEVAAHSGVTKSLIHHHFGSKEQLWGEVKMRRFRLDYEPLQREMLLQGGDPIELLDRSIDAYFTFLKNSPRFVKLISWVIVEGTFDHYPEEELMRLGSERLVAAQKAGFIRPDLDPMQIIVIFLNLCLHWFESCPHFRKYLDAVDADAMDREYLRHVKAIFFKGILPR